MSSDPAAPSWLSKLADRAILLAGIVVSFLIAIGPELWGAPEDQVRLLRAVAAALTLATAFVFVEMRALRRQVLVMEDLLSDVRFGAGTKRDRDAIDILVRALRVSDPETRETALRTLRKICGRDLGDETEAWEAWWKASRATFTRASAAATAGGPKK